MRVISATPQSIKEAGIVIKRGGLVAFPTETVYGLGADALNPSLLTKDSTSAQNSRNCV